MVPFVGEEGCNAGGSVRSVVIGKLGERKKLGPVVLLLTAVYSDVLFECLVDSFGLSVRFRMVSGSVVHTDLK